MLAGLTPSEAASATEIVRQFHASEKLTILMIEHVTRALMALSQRIVVLHHGQKIAEGTPREVASDPRTLSVYLGIGDAMSDVAFACRDVVAGYGDVEVLHGVTITVGAGTITALLGNNGAGKTTLMRTIAGVLPLRSGTLVYSGRPIGKLDAAGRVAAGIALVPEGRLVFAELSVAENLRLGAYADRARAGRLAHGPRKCTRCFRACVNDAASSRELCRAASSRCWPSRAA